jgi:hypothetical protein
MSGDGRRLPGEQGLPNLTLRGFAGADGASRSLMRDQRGMRCWLCWQRQRWMQRALPRLLCLLTLEVLASRLRRLELYGRVRPHPPAPRSGSDRGLAGRLVRVPGHGRARSARFGAAVPTVVVPSAVGLLALSLANPDGLIAKRNVQRWQETGRLDLGYLQSLSAMPPRRSPSFRPVSNTWRGRKLRERLSRGDSWSSFNLARERARAILSG